jgi:hypothetical protein
VESLHWKQRIAQVIKNFMSKDLYDKHGNGIVNFFITGLENLELGPNRANSLDDLKSSLDDELLDAVRLVNGYTEV